MSNFGSKYCEPTFNRSAWQWSSVRKTTDVEVSPDGTVASLPDTDEGN